VVEFGSGVGNFTLMLPEFGSRVVAIENDNRNLIPLNVNLANHSLTSKVNIYDNVGVFMKEPASSSSDSRLYFVNPSRSGVGPLFDRAVPADQVIYVSCHLDSFAADTAKLDQQSFALTHATLFDQFPHSEHFEIISRFAKR
jgi:23S rRNA (uracil1939-C5)-methyltransferase